MISIKDERVFGPKVKCTIFNPSTGAIMYSNNISNQLRPNIGSYKSIDSVRDGYFTPGKFRVNPTTIKSSVARAKAGSYEGLWSAPWVFRVEGNILPCGVQNLCDYWPVDYNVPDVTRNLGAVDRSIVKAYAKLNDCIWDFGTFLAEFRDTLEMLRHPFKALSTWINTNRKVARKRVGSLRWHDNQPFVTYMVDNWLQYRYGIRPLIKDIQDAITAFYIRWNLDVNKLMVKKAGDLLEITNSNTAVSGSLENLTFTVSETRKDTVKTVCGLYYHRKVMSETDKLAELLGLELVNIPVIAWELVRYSFVVDWFLGVGQWLRAIKPNPRVDYLGGYVSQVVSSHQKFEIINPWINSPSNSASVIMPSAFERDTHSLVRTVGPTIPVLPVANPNFFKIERLVDSLALLWRPVHHGLLTGRLNTKIKIPHA